jgi:hypothetical protein
MQHEPEPRHFIPARSGKKPAASLGGPTLLVGLMARLGGNAASSYCKLEDPSSQSLADSSGGRPAEPGVRNFSGNNSSHSAS